VLGLVESASGDVLDDHVTELGVRQQSPVEQEGGADARTEGQEDHQPVDSLAGAVVHLGETGGVGIVEHEHGAAGEMPVEQLRHVAPDPRFVDVVGDPRHPLVDDAGQGDPDRARPIELLGHLADALRDRVGRGGLGGAPHDSVPDEFAACEVDEPHFDPGAAHIDAEACGSARGARWEVGRCGGGDGHVGLLGGGTYTGAAWVVGRPRRRGTMGVGRPPGYPSVAPPGGIIAGGAPGDDSG